MLTLFTYAFFAALLVLTFLAAKMWYENRGKDIEPAQHQVQTRFAIGVAVFWLIAIAGYFGGFLSH
jgi:F0F1-type ATP synthase membrane subunit a